MDDGLPSDGTYRTRTAGPSPPDDPAPPGWSPLGASAWLLAVVGLPTGAALVVYLLTTLSLPAGLALCAATAACAGVVAWRRLDPRRRGRHAAAARDGVVAGLLGTAAYDAVRFALVAVFGLPLRPWEAVPLFGALLTGHAPDTATAWSAGLLYHVANGVGFAVTFALLWGRHGAVAGIGWALALEAAMMALYPGWLDITALREFTSVSMLGHVAYGAVIGATTRRRLSRRTTAATLLLQPRATRS